MDESPPPRYVTQSQLSTLYMDESPPRYVTQSQLSTLYMDESPYVCYKDIYIQHRRHWTQTQCIHQVVLFLFAYLLIFSMHVMAGYIHISAQVLRHNVDVLIHGRQTPNQCVGKHNSASNQSEILCYFLHKLSAAIRVIITIDFQFTLIMDFI